MRRSFESNPSNAPENQKEYLTQLESMTDQQLREACNKMIWLSAYANNNPISCYHWQCDYCYEECQRRGKPEIYSDTHAELMRAAR